MRSVPPRLSQLRLPQVLSSVLNPLLNMSRLVIRLFECCSGALSAGASRTAPAHDTDVKRAAGATLAASVLVSQGVLFSLVLAFVWNMSTAHPRAYPDAAAVPGGALHYQTTFGFATLANILGFTLFLLYVRAYDFFGHALNTAPHAVVCTLGIVATIAGVALTASLYAVTLSNYVRRC